MTDRPIAPPSASLGPTGKISDDAPSRRPDFSVIVPCFNEIGAVEETISALDDVTKGGRGEIVLVDDGSSDGTRDRLAAIAAAGHVPQLRVIFHTANHGYGAAIKTGVRRARSELIVIIDADGTYPADRIPDLVETAASADMVVGARTEGRDPQPWLRRAAKNVLRAHCSWLVGERIPDLNSGLRVFRKSAFERFERILPDGFSLTTTITVAMMRNHYTVIFTPITYAERVGRSKIRPVADTMGFMQLILRTGMTFAPLRLLLPLILLLGAGFAASLVYDIAVLQDLTDKTLMLLLFFMNTVLFALLADMIDRRN